MQRASPIGVARDPRHDASLGHVLRQQLLNDIDESHDSPAGQRLRGGRSFIFVPQIVDILTHLLQLAEHSGQAVYERGGKLLQSPLIEFVENLNQFLAGSFEFRCENRLSPQQPCEGRDVAFGKRNRQLTRDAVG